MKKKAKEKEILTVGKFLKETREKAQLSQRTVGREFGLAGNGQFIWNWEHELSMMPLKYFKKIARLYKIDDLTLRQEYFKYETAQHAKKMKVKYGL